MEKRTLLWLAGAVIVVIVGIVLFRFVRANGDVVSRMPGSASNWFQQVSASSSQKGEEPVIVIENRS